MKKMNLQSFTLACIASMFFIGCTQESNTNTNAFRLEDGPNGVAGGSRYGYLGADQVQKNISIPLMQYIDRWKLLKKSFHFSKRMVFTLHPSGLVLRCPGSPMPRARARSVPCGPRLARASLVT